MIDVGLDLASKPFVLVSRSSRPGHEVRPYIRKITLTMHSLWRRDMTAERPGAAQTSSLPDRNRLETCATKPARATVSRNGNRTPLLTNNPGCHPERSEGSIVVLLTGNALMDPSLRSG